MSAHLALRSGNPALSADTFRTTRVLSGEDAMTVSGVVGKTSLLLVLALASATWTWSLGAAGDPRAGTLTIVGLIGGLVAAIATVMKREWAPVTAPVYALLEGLVLGGVSAGFEARYPGLVSQAVFLTFGTLGALLIAYQSGLVRATDQFKLGVAAATGGIALFYLVSLGLGFFGVAVPLVHSSSGFGIAFSVIVVGIAALNLVLDFDFIEEGVERGAPKQLEWYAAFGLMVTLVWLYLEMLRLLAKLQERR